MKSKKVKTFTSELAKTLELKYMIGFQFTFGMKEDETITGHFLFNFEKRERNVMRDCQISCEETNIAPHIVEILKFPKSERYFGDDSFDFSKEEFEKFCNIFKELGYEVETSHLLNKTWHWLRIKNSNKDLIENQLKEIAEKFHTI